MLDAFHLLFITPLTTQEIETQQALSMQTVEIFLLLVVPQDHLQKFPNSSRPVVLVMI
jgi:hypothetical protein